MLGDSLLRQLGQLTLLGKAGKHGESMERAHLNPVHVAECGVQSVVEQEVLVTVQEWVF